MTGAGRLWQSCKRVCESAIWKASFWIETKIDVQCKSLQVPQPANGLSMGFNGWTHYNVYVREPLADILVRPLVKVGACSGVPILRADSVVSLWSQR